MIRIIWSYNMDHIIWPYYYGMWSILYVPHYMAPYYIGQISRIIWSTFPFYMNYMVILYMLNTVYVNNHNKWSILYGHVIWSIIYMDQISVHLGN